MAPQHPHIRRSADGNCHELIVHGEPFLVLGGEVQNSSMSSAEHMKSIWPELRADSVNTVLGAVTWEQVEPVEGHFDFTQLDEILKDARSNDLHLILLWFGAFKNGLSTYAPKWVKKDQTRFPRAQLRKAGGRTATADVLSLFDPKQETKHADKRAFETLMHHVKELDEEYSTVIMVQIENEVGILGDSRDGSLEATRRFLEPVPSDLVDKLTTEWDSLHDTLKSSISNFKRSSNEDASWAETFGDTPRTDELFMAYHYAQYLEYLAAAAKQTYPIPSFTNVWQNTSGSAGSVLGKDQSNDKSQTVAITAAGGQQPGDYPSGGGVVNVLDIWQLFAPSLDFIAPDIYLSDYVATVVNYRHRNQPLFVPEQRRDGQGARSMWCAIASWAIGVAPFGIDTVKVEHGHNPYKKHYELLSSVSKIVLAARARPIGVFGIFFENDSNSLFIDLELGEWSLRIEKAHVFGESQPGYGLIIPPKDVTGSRFLLIGRGFQVSFTSRRPRARFTGILSFEEKEVVNPKTGELRTRRLLNGDETRGGKHAVMPSENPDYGGYPISITIPAGTAIAEVEVYVLEEEVFVDAAESPPHES